MKIPKVGEYYLYYKTEIVKIERVSKPNKYYHIKFIPISGGRSQEWLLEDFLDGTMEFLPAYGTPLWKAINSNE